MAVDVQSFVASADELRAELAATVDPIRNSVAKLDVDIASLEATLAELKGLRKAAAAMIRLQDPSFESESKPGPKPPSSNGNHGVAPETLATIREWVVGIADEYPDGFGVRQLADRPDAPKSRATLTNAFAALSDEGTLRKDRIGQGGAVIYKRRN